MVKVKNLLGISRHHSLKLIARAQTASKRFVTLKSMVEVQNLSRISQLGQLLGCREIKPRVEGFTSVLGLFETLDVQSWLFVVDCAPLC